MLYDVIIIGSGPAGYTAAIYAIRAGLYVLLLEGTSYGGQLMNTTDVENFPGFPSGINGFELMTNMRQQCIHLGKTQGVQPEVSKTPLGKSNEVASTGSNIDIRLGKTQGVQPEVSLTPLGKSNDHSKFTLLEQDVTSVKFEVEYPGWEGRIHIVETANATYSTKTLIIATGATAKKLDIPNGERFWNNGISACAVCDGALPMFRDQPLVVVGGGDTACEEALFLSRFGSVVYMLVRTDKMRASHRMKQRVMENPKIQILYHTHVVAAYGKSDDYLTGITINREGKNENLEAAGLFYAIGHIPNTSFLPDILQKDDSGYLVTDNTKTNIPGVFACGDVQDKVYRQAITAAGTGCMAALEAERYLA